MNPIPALSPQLKQLRLSGILDGMGEGVLLTDAEDRIVLANRAFRSSRYRSRVKAYSAVYFGLLFAAAMPAVYWLWEQLFKRGHARHVFMYSQKAATPAPPPGLSSGAAG